MKVQINEHDRQAIVNAMYSAARVYRDIIEQGAGQLEETFKRQLADAERLADLVEQADTIIVQ